MNAAKFQLASDVAHVAVPSPRPEYRPLYASRADSARTTFAAIEAAGISHGFSTTEAFALAVSCLAAAHNAQNVSEGAARHFAMIVKGSSPLPDVARPDGSMPSAAWAEIEAAPRWEGKAFDAARSA